MVDNFEFNFNNPKIREQKLSQMRGVTGSTVLSSTLLTFKFQSLAHILSFSQLRVTQVATLRSPHDQDCQID